MAAENAEADFELAAKQAGSSVQDPTVKHGYQSGGGAIPEPEADDSLLVVATAVDTATEIEADVLPSEYCPSKTTAIFREQPFSELVLSDRLEPPV